jgi:hypothetical protein
MIKAAVVKVDDPFGDVDPGGFFCKGETYSSYITQSVTFKSSLDERIFIV